MTFWEEQMNHESTKLYHEKLTEIARKILHPDGTNHVLEIGLDVGISAKTFLLLEDVKLTSVDSGIVDTGIREIGAMNVGDRWKFHHVSSDEFFKNCTETFDIIFVDGDHSYEQTKKDIDNAWRFLNPGGYLIGHDFLHHKNFEDDGDYGVTQAFREFIVENNVEAHVYPPTPGIITIQK